jgi:hypothetical protein
MLMPLFVGDMSALRMRGPLSMDTVLPLMMRPSMPIELDPLAEPLLCMSNLTDTLYEWTRHGGGRPANGAEW